MTEVGAGVVERYLACLAAHDWDGLATTIADDGLTREGPFCDAVEGKQHYVAYLRKVFQVPEEAGGATTDDAAE